MPFLAPSSDAPLVALATGEELAAHRQLEAPAAQAELALAAASGTVRGYCGWRLDFAREAFAVDGNTSRLLAVPTLRLTDVVSVLVDDVELVAGTDYTWSAAGLLWIASSWWSAPRGVVVDVEHGYDPVPDEVKGVVLDLAARRIASPNGESRESAGPFAVSYGTRGLLDEEKAALDPYRLEQA